MDEKLFYIGLTLFGVFFANKRLSCKNIYV